MPAVFGSRAGSCRLEQLAWQLVADGLDICPCRGVGGADTGIRDAEQCACGIVCEHRLAGTIEHEHCIARDIEKSHELVRENFARHLGGAVDCGADVSFEMTIHDHGACVDADPARLATRGADAKPHAEFAARIARLDPSFFALGALTRKCHRPRCRSDDDGGAAQHQIAECLIRGAQSALGICFEDTDGQGGKNRIDGSILTDRPRKAVERPRCVASS